MLESGDKFVKVLLQETDHRVTSGEVGGEGGFHQIYKIWDKGIKPDKMEHKDFIREYCGGNINLICVEFYSIL